MKTPNLSSHLTALTAIGTGLIGLSIAGDADAQLVGDIKIRQPNVLVMIDTSGSMFSNQYGDTPHCNTADGRNDPTTDDDGDGVIDGGKSRWVMLLESLTGTISNVECGPETSGNGSTSYSSCERVRSNSVWPINNNHGQITGGAFGLGNRPYGWPIRKGNPKDQHPIMFRESNSCSTSGAHRWYQQSGDWDQANDGVIDTFSDQIRFGVMTFDALANTGNPTYPSNGVCPGANCNYQTFTSGFSTQWSYWWDSGANNWGTGARGGYGGNVFLPSGGATAVAGCVLIPNVGYYCPESDYDVGVKNSRAAPWYGRLMGFGRPDASVPDNQAHNEMVQLGIIGATPFAGGTTPLAGSMRDIYEFLVKDTTTEGVSLPLEFDQDSNTIRHRLGPMNDPYYTSGVQCREQYVIFVTDGEPYGDIDDTMATWARNLWQDAGVITYVVGLGLDSARWTADQVAVTPQDCSLLTVSDLNPGAMCERFNTTQWAFADDPVRAGMGIDLLPNGGVAGIPTGDDTISDGDRSAIRACCTLLEAAIAGDDPANTAAKPFFPKSQAELKTELSNVLGKIAGGSLSRTYPVFAGTTPTANPGSLGNTVYYEMRSSLEVPSSGAGPWIGNLERIRYECTAGAPTVQNLNVSRGDAFAENLKANPPERKFFTVAVDQEELAPTGSVRARQEAGGDPNNWDCLYECGNASVGDFTRLSGDDSGGVDALVNIRALPGTVDGLGGNAERWRDYLDIGNKDNAACNAITGTTNSDRCAERVAQWYGGDPNPDGPTPTRLPNALGAIYKSNPIVVTPPQPTVSDELFSSNRTSGATNSFVDQFKLRPTMLYAQSIDGMLHAFVLANNASTDPGGHFDVVNVDSLENNELWSFIPPAVLPQLWPNFNQAARLLDGPLTWSNVALSRNASNKLLPHRSAVNVQDGAGEYRTILVASGGPASAGGMYYALDVTDPVEPRFLWQLSSAGDKKDETRALFGASVPAAAITTLRLDEGSGVREVPVAILSGGSSGATPPGSSRARRINPGSYWNGNDHDPRTTIRDWGNSMPSRSVTIVELYSGRVIMRMGGNHCPASATSDHPLDKSDNEILDQKVMLPDDGTSCTGFFDSPITSAPAVYPVGTGKIATRAYVGDADGAVWRLDLSNPDPTKWSAEIAFDGYNNGGTNNTLQDAWIEAGPSAGLKLGVAVPSPNAALLGQAVLQTPIVSTDDKGSTTVTFSTGDQEGFQLASPNMVNMAISFVDEVDPVTGQFAPKMNYLVPGTSRRVGFQMAFLGGTRVTGPLNMFDGTVLMSYFTPGGGAGTCTYGVGGWCAVHYTDLDGSLRPQAVMDLGGAAGYERCLDFVGGEVVFGIQVNQKPSCDTSPVAYSGDPWLAGSYQAMTSSKSGSYEVVMHTGQGGAGENNAKTKSTRLAVPNPRTRTKVQSWVSALQ